MRVETMQSHHSSHREARGHHLSKRSASIGVSSGLLPRQENKPAYGSVDLLRRSPQPPDATSSTQGNPSLAMSISYSSHSKADVEGTPPHRHAPGLSQSLQTESSSPSNSGGSHKFDIKRLLSKPASSASSPSPSTTKSFPSSPSSRPRTPRTANPTMEPRTPEPLSPPVRSVMTDPGKLSQYTGKRGHSSSSISGGRQRKTSTGNLDSMILPINGPDNSPHRDIRNHSLPRNHRLNGPSEEKLNSALPRSDAFISSSHTPPHSNVYKFPATEDMPLSPLSGSTLTPDLPIATSNHPTSPSTSSLFYSITPASQIALEYQKTQAALEKQQMGLPGALSHAAKPATTELHPVIATQSPFGSTTNGNVVAVGSEHDWDVPGPERSRKNISPEQQDLTENIGMGVQGLTRKVSNKLSKRPKKVDLSPGPLSSTKATSPYSSAEPTPKPPEAVNSSTYLVTVTAHDTPSGNQTQPGDLDKEHQLHSQSNDERLARQRHAYDGSQAPPMERSKSGDTIPVRRQNSQSRPDQESSGSSNSFARLVRKFSFSAMRRGSTQEDSVPPVPSIPSSISSMSTSSPSRYATPIRRESTSTGRGSLIQSASPCSTTAPPSTLATSPTDSGYLSRIFKRRPSQTTNSSKPVTDTTSARSGMPRSSASTHLSSRVSSRPSFSSQNMNECGYDPIPPLPTPTPGKYNIEPTYTHSPSQSTRGAVAYSDNLLTPQLLDRPPSHQPSFQSPSTDSLTPTPTGIPPSAPPLISALLPAPVSQVPVPAPAPAPLKKRNSLRKRVPSLRTRTASTPDDGNTLSVPTTAKQKRPRTAGGDSRDGGAPGRFGFGQKSGGENSRLRSNSLDGSGGGIGMAKPGVKGASTTSITFLGDKDRPGTGRKTQDEKDAMWDELMRRSDRAGGTLHASVGGVKLASDELDNVSPI